MTHHGDTSSGVSLYDQDDLGEGGYFRNVPLRRGLSVRSARSTRPMVSSRNRHRRGYLVPLLVLAVSLAGLGWLEFGRDSVSGTESAATAVDEVAPLATLPATTALFIQTDGTGSTVSFTAVSIRRGEGASVVFIPAATMVEVPGFGLDELSVAGDLGGVDLARLSVENLLTIGFDHVVELTPTVLSQLTRPFDPLLVDNPSRVDAVDENDRVEIIYPTGVMLLGSNLTADFLARRAFGESDLDRLVRHQSFWTGFLTARSEVVASDRDAAADVDQFLDELAVRSDAIEYRILDVRMLGGESEIYGVDREALPAVINSLDPGRDPGTAPTVVQVLNGVGVPGLAPGVAERMIDVGASIQLVDNANRFDYEITQIVYYRDDRFDAAVRIQGALGVGELVKAVDPIDVVDVTVVVGADLASELTNGFSEVGPLSRTEVEFGEDSDHNVVPRQ